MALAAPAAAQTASAPDARTLALAAGWKALFLCSGTFVAGLDEATIADTDLQGAYPELQPHLEGLAARIERKPARALVDFDPLLPPRIASFDGGGCTLQPVGRSSDFVPPPPGIDIVTGVPTRPLPSLPLMNRDAEPWPIGDRDATRTLTGARARSVAALLVRAFGDGFGAGTRTSAVLVVHDGRIVAERYRPGFTRHTPQRTWSVAKSLTSMLVGAMVHEKLVDVQAAVQVPSWGPTDPRSAITLDQLLRMQSGLWTDGPGNRTDSLYFGGSSVSQTALVMPLEAAPGSRFRYANNDTLIAAHSLLNGTNARDIRPLWRHVIRLAGMTRTTVEADWQEQPVLSSQVWMTARDMARLALLHLNDGVASKVRILPEGWVRDATSQVGPQPSGDMGYGRSIWLMGPKQGLPEGSYAFLGNRGQVAIVVPSARLVVVRRGFDPAGSGFDGAALTAALLEVLD